MNEQTITLNLPASAVNVLLSGLSELKLRDSRAVFDEVVRQATEQIESSNKVAPQPAGLSD